MLPLPTGNPAPRIRLWAGFGLKLDIFHNQRPFSRHFIAMQSHILGQRYEDLVFVCCKGSWTRQLTLQVAPVMQWKPSIAGIGWQIEESNDWNVCQRLTMLRGLKNLRRHWQDWEYCKIFCLMNRLLLVAEFSNLRGMVYFIFRDAGQDDTY